MVGCKVGVLLWFYENFKLNALNISFLCDIDNVSIFPLTYNTTLIKFIINYHLFNSLYTFTITFTRYNLHVVQWMTMLQLLCIFFIKIGKDFLLYIPEIRASLSFVIKKLQHLTATKT